ncbi:MAG TPA: cytochrome c biogenesis protein CcsA [Pirellulaceae bacterium]|nr:cytochrome c biogenesis protein CcsA [Pirellulaceae bacterium]
MASITTEDSDSSDAMPDSLDTTLSVITTGLRPLASLRLTVVLFALSIVIVLVGTLAQVNMDMWEVMDRYFLSWFAWIEFQVFFPRSWFPNLQNVPFGIPFPGGAMIGALLALNLATAHVVRFKVQAKSRRMVVGLVVLLVGIVLTSLVVLSGHNMTGLQGNAPVSWATSWLLVKVGVAVTGLALLVGTITLPLADSRRRIERVALGSSAVILLVTAAWLFLAGDGAYLGDAGMRILWQLIQCGFSGGILLVGCILLFKKRGGIVLIHLGVGLLMFGQFWVAKYDIEEQMTIEENTTVSFAKDIRRTELAVIDSSDTTKDVVVVIPQPLLLQSVRLAKGKLDGGPGHAQRGIRDWFGSPPFLDDQGIIHHDDLPFDVQVLVYYKNADLEDPKTTETNLATDGTGLNVVAKPVRAASGASSSSVDLAAAYVKLLSKENGQELGTFLLSQIASSQDIVEEVAVADHAYEMSLRFARSYKPYSVTLVDVRKDDYLGTSTPRNYSSDIHLVDADRGTDRNVRIWMNNPLRYAGETIYQTGYAGPPQVAKETTTLSIVTNSGWMIPYVACMLVATGMLAHFLSVLLRFLKRREGAAATAFESVVEMKAAKQPGKPGKGKQKSSDQASSSVATTAGSEHWASIAVPVAVVGLFAILFFRAANRPEATPGEMDLQAVGELPVIADGRVKPFDTLARNTLRVISTRESFKGRIEGTALKEQWPEIVADLHKKWPAVDAAKLKALDGDIDAAIEMVEQETEEEHYVVDNYVDILMTERLPAIRWLMDVIARPAVAEKHKVFRIDNLEVLDMLKLNRRKSNCYSVEEIRGGVEEFERQVDIARRLDVEKLSTFQRKLLELDQRVRSFTQIGAAFQPPTLPPLPTPEEFEKDRATATSKIGAFRQAYFGFMQSIDSIHPPLAVPNEEGSTVGGEPHEEDDDQWQPYAKAWATALINVRMLGQDPPPSLEHLNKIIVAYGVREPEEFNDEVQRYKRHLRRDGPPQLKSKYAKTGLTATGLMTTGFVERYFGTFYGFEAYFNYVSPFFFCWWPYLLAFVLTATSWLVWPKPLNRAAFWLIVFTLVIHTLALAARIYISGRPPVTNLYSSSVFIGWGAVIFGLVLEYLYRNGVGNIVAATIGFATMVIAHNLAGDGDTFTVLQAVLDTQFWLATHVVCITLGYSTTFLAGAIGLIYVLWGVFTSQLNAPVRKDLARMIYGVTCFAIFFSFVGTVLGGLWADDSWGRFWGWDPKENGALLLVLWNALVLHARWGGVVKERGLAILALSGNIVTAWSWFGVNELGVGLHSYGFTEGVLPMLAIFVGSQLVVAAIGCLPLTMWLSYRAERDQAKALAG